jgi:predicted metal-dependent HD superfamily phosphohydrolase
VGVSALRAFLVRCRLTHTCDGGRLIRCAREEQTPYENTGSLTEVLHTRWINLCDRIGLPGERQWTHFEVSYGSADRAYHNLGHIEYCLAQLDASAAIADSRVGVELALWFHDCIYDTRRSDNEERSAEVARAFLQGTPFETAVPHLVLATTHDARPGNRDSDLICDIDLSILGSESAVYDSYALAIRSEYSWVPSDKYTAGRIKVLRTFLNRPHLYGLHSYRDRLESQARENIRSEIERLKDSADS